MSGLIRGSADTPLLAGGVLHSKGTTPLCENLSYTLNFAPNRPPKDVNESPRAIASINEKGLWAGNSYSWIKIM
jgi:hypothetical protein